MGSDRMRRRRFLHKFSAGLAAAVTASPQFRMARAGEVSANGRIQMGFIGVGRMGFGHLRAFLGYPDVRVLAVCDVRASHRERAVDRVNRHYGNRDCRSYEDFRELLARSDIDAVLIAVPDHWHVLIGCEAARRGKAMYFEKPVGRSVREGQTLRETIRRYGVVFQFGTQQRSSHIYRHTCELVRNGYIGQLQTMMIGSALPSPPVHPPRREVPPGLNYDLWLGPAPWKPYNDIRCSFNWTLIYDYSLGCVGGAWGIHDVDIAQWVNDSENTGPIAVEGWGKFPRTGLYDTAEHWEVEHSYANGVRLIHMDMRTALTRADQFNLEWMGMLFLGDEGWIYASRKGLHTHPAALKSMHLKPGDHRVRFSNNHRRDFLDAVHRGTRPIAGIEAAIRSDIICHQADIAMRIGRPLRWDPFSETFLDDPIANRKLSRAMRSPWYL